MAININGDAPPNSSRTSEEDPERGRSTAKSIFAPQTTAEIAERQRIGEEMWELRQTIRFVSREIFGTNNLRTYQMKALVGCLNPKYCESKMLFVTRTGYGKSHVMRTLGVVLGGVVVIFVPLLSLSADQMNKMKEANQNYGTVETHHLDEFPTDDGDQTLNNLVNRIAQLQDDTTSTIFLFTSPQFLCQQSHKPLLDELLSAHKRGVLRVVGIDEAHLFVQHSSFRVEIHMLTELFFKKVFDKERPKSHPVLLAMTATMPDQFIPKLEALIATRPPLVRPPELDHFEQRHIKMEFGVNCVSFVPELDRLVGVITDTIKGENHDASVRVVALTTLASTTIALDEKLCEKLNKKKCDVDVVVVHGQLHKLDKFYNMRLFCAKLEYEHFRPRALVTNGAGNTGIDSENITEMLRAGWPTDLPTVFQERGRCARGIDMKGRIRYVTNIKSLVQCLYLLHGLQNSSSTDDVATNTNNRFGSAIQHASTASTETNESDVDKNVKKICQIRMARGSRELLAEKRSMLLEVMKFFCLDLGCYHLRAEYYLFHGKLVPVDKRKRCDGMCSICDGDWSKKHRRVRKRMLISWFLSSDFTEPVKADGLTDMLWKGKKDPEQNREEDFWIKKIFDANGKKSLKKYHVECLMQSLIAAEIITWKINAGKVEWWLNRVIKNDVPECCYSYDEYWEGIPLL